jgi:hypothetical protein
VRWPARLREVSGVETGGGRAGGNLAFGGRGALQETPATGAGGALEETPAAGRIGIRG